MEALISLNCITYFKTLCISLINACMESFNCQKKKKKTGSNCKYLCKDLTRIRADTENTDFQYGPKPNFLFWLTMQTVSLNINIIQYAARLSSPLVSGLRSKPT